MKKPLVAILGAGPAGLFAAHACELYGVPFVVFSAPVKSRLGGAQYLHADIPALTTDRDSVTLTYHLEGTVDGYREKVYGGIPVPFVSAENISDGKQVQAWSLRDAYEELWLRYSSRICSAEIDSQLVEDLLFPFDLVFSSVPAPSLCANFLEGANHWFRSRTVRIFNAAINEELPDNTILYDGTAEHSYYRMSRIFGVGSTEWDSSAPRPPLPEHELKTVSKPIATNCDCHPDVIRIGRFGTHNKGVLSHDSFFKVRDIFIEEWRL